MEKDLKEHPENLGLNYVIGKMIVKGKDAFLLTKAQNHLEICLNLGSFALRTKSLFYIAFVHLERRELGLFYQYYHIARKFYKTSDYMEEFFHEAKEIAQMYCFNKRNLLQLEESNR